MSVASSGKENFRSLRACSRVIGKSTFVMKFSVFPKNSSWARNDRIAENPQKNNEQQAMQIQQAIDSEQMKEQLKGTKKLIRDLESLQSQCDKLLSPHNKKLKEDMISVIKKEKVAQKYSEAAEDRKSPMKNMVINALCQKHGMTMTDKIVSELHKDFDKL